MIAGVELDGRIYQVELRWDKVEVPPGEHAWWLVSVDGDPRPTGKDIGRIYRGALELVEKVMHSDRSER